MLVLLLGFIIYLFRGERVKRDELEREMKELGVTREDLPAVAKQARYDGAALYNETEITLEDAMAVLEAAY